MTRPFRACEPPNAVHQALEELPDDQRVLIELAYWSELSQSEIATRLDLPLRAVRTQIRAALTGLADVLERREHR